jgi:hypothetical protein
MNDGLHVLCPRCDADNPLTPEQFVAGPTCAHCHASLFETLSVFPAPKPRVAEAVEPERPMRRWA